MITTATTVLEVNAARLLDLLQRNPGRWHSRADLAKLLGKKALTNQHQAGLELLILEGKIAVRSALAPAAQRHAHRLEYSLVAIEDAAVERRVSN